MTRHGKESLSSFLFPCSHKLCSGWRHWGGDEADEGHLGKTSVKVTAKLNNVKGQVLRFVNYFAFGIKCDKNKRNTGECIFIGYTSSTWVISAIAWFPYSQKQSMIYIIHFLLSSLFLFNVSFIGRAWYFFISPFEIMFWTTLFVSECHQHGCLGEANFCQWP